MSKRPKADARDSGRTRADAAADGRQNRKEGPAAPGTAVDGASSPASSRRTRGGHEPTGTSANRRAKAARSSGRKGERTRRALIESARAVFERVGYVDARVKDIVDEAGIAHGSFYTYFPSKREVFQEVILDLGQDISAAVAHTAEDDGGDTIENLRHANRRYLEVYRANATLLQLYEQVATIDDEISSHRIEGRRRHVQRVAQTIARLQGRGQADESLDPTITASALVAMLGSYAHWSTVKSMEQDIDTTADMVTLIWIRALRLTPTPHGGSSYKERREPLA